MHQLLLIGFFLSFFGGPAYAASETPAPAARPILLDSSRSMYDVGNLVSVLVDPDGGLTLGDALSPAGQAGFARNPLELIDHGGGRERVWVRLDVRPTGGAKVEPEWVLEVGLPDWSLVELYAPDPGAPNGFRRIPGAALGQTQPESESYRNFTYRLADLPDSGEVFYLRLAAVGPTAVPLTILRGDAFQKHAAFDFFSFGLVYGVMLSMVLYNFFIWLSLQSRVYATYVAYMLSFLCYLLLLNGHAAVLFGVAGCHWARLEWFFLGSAIMLVVTFCKQFLVTRANTPRLHLGLNLFHGLGLLVILCGLTGFYDEAAITAYLAGATGPAYVCVVGAVRRRQGFGPATFYILANISLLIGTLGFVLWSFGLFPPVISGDFMLTLGPAADSLLLSFALADRIRQLRREKVSLARSRAHYKRISELDGLTGLYNKGVLFERLGRETEEAAEYGRPLSLLILDVDNFKRFNDTYGHPEGDVVLQTLSAVIKKEIRGHDAAFRYGGEEFVIVFPNTGVGQSLPAAERIRKAFAGQIFASNGDGDVSVTVSLGLAQFRPGENMEGFIRRADQALYDAKHQGKNNVVVVG